MVKENKKELTEEDKELIYNGIEEILKNEFTDVEKKTIKHGFDHDRVNFACPYCGDSTTDLRKKRGNLYWDTLQYHCFNCGKHTDVVDIFRDFDLELDKDKLIGYKSLVKHSKEKTESKSNDSIIFNKLKEYGVPLEKFENYYGLIKIENSKNVYRWCKSRILTPFSHFLRADPKDNKVWIINYDIRTQKVIGYQTRNLSKKTFYTCNLRNLRTEFNLKNDGDIHNYSSISLFFNILNINFGKKVTVFESAIDSFFIKNSISVGSVTKNLDKLKDLNCRYFFDNDKAGKTKSMEMLKDGYEVFMWKKFIWDFKLLSYKKTTKDLNDVIGICYTHKLDAHKYINDYFTNEKIRINYV